MKAGGMGVVEEGFLQDGKSECAGKQPGVRHRASMRINKGRDCRAGRRAGHVGGQWRVWTHWEAHGVGGTE